MKHSQYLIVARRANTLAIRFANKGQFNNAHQARTVAMQAMRRAHAIVRNTKNA